MDTFSQQKILVIEDQTDLNALIALNLHSLNFEVVQCHNGIDGLNQALSQTFDVILLDVMLPGLDGLNICQTLRKANITTPIIMLTAKKTEEERIIGLDSGADDYLTKPFSIRELQARVKAQLRRAGFQTLQKESTEHTTNNVLAFHNLTIDKQQRKVLLNQKSLSFTAKEFDLLTYLASAPGKVFSREQLLNSVWGYTYSGYEHTVNSHINRLRSKLEINAHNPKFVETVWGIGYKFNADSAL